MPRRRLSAGTGPLTDRQLFVLRALDEIEQTGRWGRRGVPAFAIADRLIAEGMQKPSMQHQRGYANGAANTLSALGRRGLVTGADTAGCYVSADWSITDTGREAIADTTTEGT